MASDFLDASALLALINDEPGAAVVRRALDAEAMMSVVNFAEVVSKLVTNGFAVDEAVDLATLSGITLVDLDQDVAIGAGARHAALRRRGLSLADAICLESAAAAGVQAVTAERAWPDAASDVRVLLIR